MQQEKIIAHYNGQKFFLHELKVPINDRAFMFGDAVYEVMRVYNGHALWADAHLSRLEQSLRAVKINNVSQIRECIMANIVDNKISEGMVYVQISRGEAPRNHSFYQLPLTPNVLIYSKSFPSHPARVDQEVGIAAITHEDLRWARCDIKTVNLLANCLLQTKAHEEGAADALMFRDGMLTEATAANVFFVKDHEYVTPPLSHFILPGTRRAFLVHALKKSGRKLVERAATKEELFSADEIFITSTVKEVVPVIKLDQRPVGKGQPGDFSRFALRLMEDAITLGA